MSILIQPLITEKLTRLQEMHQQYAFEVARNSTKPQIRKAIEERYPEVKVARVIQCLCLPNQKADLQKVVLSVEEAESGKKQSLH